MSQIEKLIESFIRYPEGIRFSDIEKILDYLGFVKIRAKGSHVKFKNLELDRDIVFAIHNNECKPIQKKAALSTLKFLNIL